MARLPRPYIPLKVRLQVATRQASEVVPYFTKDAVGVVSIASEWTHVAFGNQSLKCRLASTLKVLFNDNYTRAELHHRPALMNRVTIMRGDKIIAYSPDANDPDYLVYLLDDAHDIETRVRGVGAQLSDQGMARKRKNIVRNRDPKRRKFNWPKGRKIQNRKMK